jgi:hypothetical protein
VYEKGGIGFELKKEDEGVWEIGVFFYLVFLSLVDLFVSLLDYHGCRTEFE